MKIVIDIPEYIYNEIKEKHEISAEKFIRHTAYLELAVENGVPLPKGHSNLCDENQVVASLVRGGFLKDDVKCGDITKILDRATIIEADKAENKEYGVKVINRGNCIMCGKKLTEGLLFCKECEAKGK